MEASAPWKPGAVPEPDVSLVTTSAVIVPSGSLRPGINPKRVVGSAFSRTGTRDRTQTPALAVNPVSITAPSGPLSCDVFRVGGGRRSGPAVLRRVGPPRGGRR